MFSLFFPYLYYIFHSFFWLCFVHSFFNKKNQWSSKQNLTNTYTSLSFVLFGSDGLSYTVPQVLSTIFPPSPTEVARHDWVCSSVTEHHRYSWTWDKGKWENPCSSYWLCLSMIFPPCTQKWEHFLLFHKNHLTVLWSHSWSWLQTYHGKLTL